MRLLPGGAQQPLTRMLDRSNHEKIFLLLVMRTSTGGSTLSPPSLVLLWLKSVFLKHIVRFSAAV